MSFNFCNNPILSGMVYSYGFEKENDVHVDLDYFWNIQVIIFNWTNVGLENM